MRSILVALTLVLFLIISLPFWVILKLVGVFNRHACAVASQAIVTVAFRLIMWLTGARITVLGVENIPTDRAVLFTGNHRSYADIPLGYMTIPGLVGFVAKKEIGKVPILSWWMGNMHCLFLDRTNLRKGFKTIMTAADYVNQGYSMFIMPEGTRNHNPEMMPFHEGSFKVAEKTGCPIIPVAISNTDALYELHRPSIKAADVVIHYGKPIETAGLSKLEFRAVTATVRTEIERMLEEDRKYIHEK